MTKAITPRLSDIIWELYWKATTSSKTVSNIWNTANCQRQIELGLCLIKSSELSSNRILPRFVPTLAKQLSNELWKIYWMPVSLKRLARDEQLDMQRSSHLLFLVKNNLEYLLLDYEDCKTMPQEILKYKNANIGIFYFRSYLWHFRIATWVAFADGHSTVEYVHFRVWIIGNNHTLF